MFAKTVAKLTLTGIQIVTILKDIFGVQINNLYHFINYLSNTKVKIERKDMYKSKYKFNISKKKLWLSTLFSVILLLYLIINIIQLQFLGFYSKCLKSNSLSLSSTINNSSSSNRIEMNETTMTPLFSHTYLHLDPPRLDRNEFYKSLDILENYKKSNQPRLGEKYLSTLIQNQIEKLQTLNCDGPNLQCGHEDYCGLGCQIHHRIACVMLSYATNLPLIHTVDCDGWSGAYSDRWSDVFLPLGSNCSPGANTFVWKWVTGPSISDCNVNQTLRSLTKEESISIYPLSHGIFVDDSVYELIQKIRPTSFISILENIPWDFSWMLGQFTKYTMRLSQDFEDKLQQWKMETKFNSGGHPIVGLHVRLTDKFTEAPSSVHKLEEYLIETEKYFHSIESLQNLSKNSLQRRIFLASDNTTILKNAQKMHPDWDIIGFESTYSSSLTLRENGLAEIARDILLLSECDYVICGFSSNVCRLILEMRSFLRFNDQGSEKSIKSLDGSYSFILWKGLVFW